MIKALRVGVMAAVLPATAIANMNGAPGQYKIANGNPQSPVPYSTDYTAEYFEVYSPPIKTQYGEVYWRDAGLVPLPDTFQQRYLNKSVAIIGYEIDVVTRTANGDVSVPMNEAYNHHFEAELLNSKHVRMGKREVTPEIMRRVMTHGKTEVLMPELFGEPVGVEPEASLVHCFYTGNGGEIRLSYKGLPKGYAQVLHSPDNFRISPMMVDTKNRHQKGIDFLSGPLPRSSQAPPNATYSGLIECPCSTRLKKEYSMTYSTRSSGTCQDSVANASECFAAGRTLIQAENYTEHTVSDASVASACSLVERSDGAVDLYWNTITGTSCGIAEQEGTQEVVAFAASFVNLTVVLRSIEGQRGVPGPQTAIITVAGPASKWLGVGFGTDSMCIKPVADTCPTGGPYAIIITGDKAEDVVERKLDFHGPGVVLEPSITVVSNTVVDGIRTLVVTRAMKGLTDQHYTFDPSVQSVPFINANGCSLMYAQHCGHGPSMLHFVTAEVPACACRAGVRGTIGGNAFPYPTSCNGFPASDLLVQRNPTCFVDTYVGGLNCCRDGHSLLDEDQAQPWPGDYQTVQVEFRFYFEDHVRALHQNTVWFVHISEAEYDIVQCLPGTPSSQCVQVVTSRWTVVDMLQDCSALDNTGCTGIGSRDPQLTAGVKIIRINPHCHAPHCLSMELYNADSGQLLCRVQPVLGSGSALFDEKDYINIPPCVWGDSALGLVEPPLLPLGTTLQAIKRNNNTYGHTGEMGHWQMRGIVVPRSEEVEASAPGRNFGEGRGLQSTDFGFVV